MCARTGQLRAEGCCARANGNLVLRSPQDSLVIVAALRHILKGHYFCFGCGASGNSPLAMANDVNDKITIELADPYNAPLAEKLGRDISRFFVLILERKSDGVQFGQRM